MPETMEAARLGELSAARKITDCIVEDSISLDIALGQEAAQNKGNCGMVAGNADILLVPNIQVGDVLGKSITVLAKGKMAGFIVGAQVPIILTSRSSSSEEKYLSIALACAASVQFFSKEADPLVKDYHKHFQELLVSSQHRVWHRLQSWKYRSVPVTLPI